jgi:sec-independent protein translocase protein TatB
VFGVSFSEIVLVCVVALLVAGPHRLPEVLGTLGSWISRLRNMTSDLRRQTGIDDILRNEGLSGGLNELRSIMRTDPLAALRQAAPGRPAASKPAPVSPDAVVDAYGEAIDFDRFREFPIEGVDAYGAIPEDLAPKVTPAVPPLPPAPAEGSGTPAAGEEKSLG